MTRTAFLIDGFNLYHSLKDASYRLGLGGAGTRWLDLRSFCSSFLHIIGGGAQVSSVHYFSALARHLEATRPHVTARHVAYIECLRSTDVRVELAQFKEKKISCPHCRQEIKRHEEKETDVAVAVTLVELFVRDECDAAVLVTGDSDIAPAVRLAQRLFPRKAIYCCFPFNRQSLELKSLALKSFKVAKERYARHQFPDPVMLPGGRRVSKPAGW